jgi:tetratricopeptide (TPR) repeat protein
LANKDKLLASAQKFLSKGQLPKAIAEYRKIVDAFPKDVRNRQKLAELLSRDKRNEEALTEYEAVARHYTETGFYLKSIAVFKQMQKIEPSRVDIYHRLAELNEKQGLVGNALTEYRSLVAFYEKNKMTSEAVEVLEKMSSLDPENLNVTAKIAECYMAAGRHDEAYAQFSELIGTLSAQGEHTKIIKLYERFIEICPLEVETRLPLALALLASGATDKAIQLLKELLQSSPDDPAVIRCMSDAYVARGDYPNALLTLRHLLKKQESDLDLREHFVQVSFDGGEFESARDRLEMWKDDFFRNDRVELLKSFYQRLAQELSGDPVVAATMDAISIASGEEPVATTEATDAVVSETADGGLDDALNDIESLEMVGEEAPDDVEVPAFDSEEPSAHKTPEKSAAAGLELDLDLDLDLDLPATRTARKMAESVVESVEAEDSEESEEAQSAEVEVEEVEVEIDLGGIDDLSLELEDDAGLAPVEEAPVEEAPVANEPLEELEEIEELEDLEEVEELVELEELEDLEEVEELEELEAPEPLTAEGADRPSFAESININSELEEAEFYLQQGLFDDAERVVATLMEYHPDMPELVAKLDEIHSSRQAAVDEPDASAFVDLMADLKDDDLLAATDFLDDAFDDDTAEDDELSQKLVSELDSSDTESHYNLGIAYKEMGLYDDAVAEFEKAFRDPARAVDCKILMGQCHVDAGNAEAAIETFRGGLAIEGLNDEAQKTLNFELGMAYQQDGKLLEALECFQQVAEKDHFFRDVAELIKTLRVELGLDDSDDNGGPQGDRDRVSYV